MDNPWGRGLESLRAHITRVSIPSEDPLFNSIDFDAAAHLVTALKFDNGVMVVPRRTQVECKPGELVSWEDGFAVRQNSTDYDWLSKRLVSSDGVWDLYREEIERGNIPRPSGFGSDGVASWHDASGSYTRALFCFITKDLDEALALAGELAKHEPRKVEYNPKRKVTKEIANEAVYAALGYEASTEPLEGDYGREVVLPKGIRGYYLSVDNDADVKLVGGDTVYLNSWGRIEGAAKGGKYYGLTCS